MNKDLVNIINSYVNNNEANTKLITFIVERCILAFTESMVAAIKFEKELIALFNKYKLVCTIKLVDKTSLKPKFVVDAVQYHNLHFFTEFTLLCLRYYEYENWFDNAGKTIESGFRENTIRCLVTGFNELAVKLNLKIRIIYWYVNRYEIAFVV